MAIYQQKCLVAFNGILLLLASTACSSALSRNQPNPKGAILSVNQVLHIESKTSPISIAYGGPTTRVFKIDEWLVPVAMISRQDPFQWSGQIGGPISGIYNPGNTRDLGHDYDGLRIIYQESFLNFSPNDEFSKFKYQGSAIQSRIFGKDGLMVAIYKTNDKWVIDVNVWKIFINGNVADFSDLIKESVDSATISTDNGN